jgi:hypothetical protein
MLLMMVLGYGYVEHGKPKHDDAGGKGYGMVG